MFATEVVSPKGKIIKRYLHEDVKTPLECLALLDEKGLVKFKKGNTLQALQAQAKVQTDLQAAQAMQKAKAALFATFNTAYFSDRGRLFQRDRGRRFRLIVDAQGCAQARV